MTATADQLASVGRAARELLRFAWTRKPRFDLMVIHALMAVAKTFASDPVASAALLRQAIEPDHLKEHGYKELRWIAHHIGVIARNDPALAVDIYRAAYGYQEDSSGTTTIGNSVLLQLRSNRRQDYEGAWFQLSEAIPAILNDNLEAGVSAVVGGLDGYVQRSRHHDPYPGEPGTASFSFNSSTANFKVDSSHSWYRGGFQPVQDGPVLLKKFDAFLDRLVSDGDPQEKIGRILRALSQEPNVVAAIWGSLLVAGTRQPSLWAQQLLPLASAAPIMLSSDTRYQLGNFIGAVYEHLPESGRGVIERAILSLPDDRAGERSKAALAGCIPKARVATDEMQVFLETLQQAGKTRPNAPPFQITSSTRPFDTDAYLASEGVSLEDPDSAALRELMRGVEALSTPGGTPSLSLTSVKRQVGIFDGIRKALLQRFRGRVPDKLFDHAVGQMAEAAGRIARSQPRVLAAPSVKGPLKRVLLFSAASESPHYNPEHERDFHENLSWGGPSARTAAAHGLLDLRALPKNAIRRSWPLYATLPEIECLKSDFRLFRTFRCFEHSIRRGLGQKSNMCLRRR